MATAAQVIKASLQRILVQASEADLEPDEYQDAIFAMNNFMMSLDADGVHLGYTQVKNLGDDITIPVGALRGLIANLAIEISPDYSGTITDALASSAKLGLDVMRKIGQSIPVSSFPSTLPTGSGNDYGENYHFYNEESKILGENSGLIGLEDNTADATR